MIHERDQRVGEVERRSKKGKYFTPSTTDKDCCLYLEFVSDVNGRYLPFNQLLGSIT